MNEQKQWIFLKTIFFDNFTSPNNNKLILYHVCSIIIFEMFYGRLHH